jgi:cobalt-zinc-cadmium efflux system outer membrane protein
MRVVRLVVVQRIQFMVFKSSGRVLATSAGVMAVALAIAPLSAAPSPAKEAADPALAGALRQAWLSHPASAATEATLAAARARAEAAGQPLYNPEAELAYDDDGDRTATAGLSLTLDLSGKRAARAAAGAAELGVTEAQARLRRSVFVRQWLLGWAEYRTASRKVAQGLERVELMQRFVALAEKQQIVGDISTLERDLALLSRDEAQAEQATLEADAASALESFRAVGGTLDAARLEAVAEPPDLAKPEGWTAERLPEAILAAAGTRSAQQRIELAERERRPDPTLGLSVGRIDFGPTSDNVLGLTLSVPIFVRNNFSAEVSAARADSDGAAAEQRLALIELEARAERALATYDAIHAAWLRWSRSSGTDAASRAHLLERLWRAGELSTADYLIQLKQTLDTELAGTDLQGRLWTSHVEALAALGVLDAWIGFDPIADKVTP